MAAPRIIPCSEWGARAPRHGITVGGPIRGAIFHHTAGHHPNLDHVPSESRTEAATYARAIQNFHMDNPDRRWADSGHNFLVCRNGLIFEGRHRSLELLMQGRTPVSAHCPGKNATHSGVEIEHVDGEKMTTEQWAAAVWLFALICRKGNVGAGAIDPHRKFFATACPGSLTVFVPEFKNDVARALHGTPPPSPAPSDDPAWYDKYGPKKKPPWVFALLREYARRLKKS